jgi:hypothetical protein
MRHGQTLQGLLGTTATVLIMTASLGCVHVQHHRQLPSQATVRKSHAGPPPHAPAHGYRHKQHGVELVFDSGIGVYVVVGHPNHYHDGKRYYRLSGQSWQVSARLHGAWVTIASEKVPAGLRGKPKKHKRHRVPAKHGY